MEKKVSCGSINVVTLGATGTGKTSFLAGIFHTFFWNRYRTSNSELIVQARSKFQTDDDSNDKDGSFISNLRNFKRLKAAVERREGTQEKGIYNLDLYVENYNDTYLLPVSLYDYKGGIARVSDVELNKAEINDLRKHLHESDVVYVLVDSTLAKQYDQRRRSGLEEELCTRFFSEIICSVIRENPYKPKYIQFVLTKWDAVDVNEQAIVKACVRDLFDDIIRECKKLEKNYGWRYDMLPVSLFGKTTEQPKGEVTQRGDETRVTKYDYTFQGEMQPERIDMAFLCALERALSMKCDWARKNCDQNDLLMARIYELIKCYPLGIKEKRQFLDELDKVKDIKDKNVRSRYDSEYVQKMIAAHPSFSEWEESEFIRL